MRLYLGQKAQEQMIVLQLPDGLGATKRETGKRGGPAPRPGRNQFRGLFSACAITTETK